MLLYCQGSFWDLVFVCIGRRLLGPGHDPGEAIAQGAPAGLAQLQAVRRVREGIAGDLGPVETDFPCTNLGELGEMAAPELVDGGGDLRSRQLDLPRDGPEIRPRRLKSGVTGGAASREAIPGKEQPPRAGGSAPGSLGRP